MAFGLIYVSQTFFRVSRAIIICYLTQVRVILLAVLLILRESLQKALNVETTAVMSCFIATRIAAAPASERLIDAVALIGLQRVTPGTCYFAVPMQQHRSPREYETLESETSVRHATSTTYNAARNILTTVSCL
jgi:hypothetical protein